MLAAWAVICCKALILPSRSITSIRKARGDYYTAGAKLSHQVDLNGGNGPYSGNDQAVNVPSIQYFEDVFSYMANAEYQGESATQAVYDLEWAPFRSNLGATSALADLDFYCSSPVTGQSYNCPCSTALLAGPVLVALCAVFPWHELLQRRPGYLAASDQLRSQS